jgi:hypothetical protein
MSQNPKEWTAPSPLSHAGDKPVVFNPWVFAVLGFAVFFCLFHYWMGGFNAAHVLYMALWVLLYLLMPKTRIFFILILPIFLHNILYDAFRYIPFSWLQPIHVQEPYALDARLFGIKAQGHFYLFHEYLLQWAHPALDFFAGIVYHLLDPMVFILVLLLWWLGGRDLAARYSSAFLLMNLFAFATYLFYPAAAPWYVEKYGFVPPVAPVLGDAAGLSQFDKLIGADLSQDFYGLCPVVFGAIPSMHAGFTMLGWLYARKLGKAWTLGYGFFALGMWWAALYLQHHYLIDVLLGILYAVVAYALIEGPLLPGVRKVFQKFFSHLGPHEAWTLWRRTKK